MHDLRSPADMDRQREIEAIPEDDRTEVQKKTLATLKSMAFYAGTALGDH